MAERRESRWERYDREQGARISQLSPETRERLERQREARRVAVAVPPGGDAA